MKCKPGDLAMVVESTSCPDNVGKIVRVLLPAEGKAEPAWWFEPPLFSKYGGLVTGCFDRCLQPFDGVCQTKTNASKEAA